MGFGGALIWTGLAHNLKTRNPDKHIIFLYKRTWRDFISRQNRSDHIVYKNNKDIAVVTNRVGWLFKKRNFEPKETIIVDMARREYNYCIEATKDAFRYKAGKHAIQITCDVHNIDNAELKPKIWLTPQEISRGSRLLAAFYLKENHYICIEPHTKSEIMPNKQWFWERWQELVDLLNGYFYDNQLPYKIVQVGIATDKILNGVVDLTGTTTFREAAYILKQAITFVGCMGGLAHLSKAVGKRSVVLVSAWEPVELASYPDDINLYSDVGCKHCGLIVPCPSNRQCMQEISAKQVFNSILLLLGKKNAT